MIRRDTTIRTTLGGEGVPIDLSIRDGRLEDDSLFVHVTLPAAQCCHNVVYACSTILPFSNESDVDEWCERHRIDRGEVLPIGQVWKLAQRWYGSLLDGPWRRKTLEEARGVFADVGLTGEFWDPGAGWR